MRKGIGECRAITLTTGADAMTGTSNNDTFVGTEATLSSADVLNGGAGTDMLRVANSGAAKTFSAIELSSIETIQVTADGTGATTFDLTGTAGVTKLTNMNSSQDMTFNGVGTIPSVGVAMQGVTAGNTTVAFTTDAVAGTADTLNVALNGAINTTGNTAIGTLTANGIETIAVTTSGAASNLTAIASNAMKAMTVAGDKNLTLAGATFADTAAVNTLDASTFTGALNVTLSNTGAANIDVKVTGGSGADRADFSNGFDTSDNFTGGAGRDTLALTQAIATAQTATTGGTVSAVEILEVTDASAVASTIDMDNFSGVDTVYYSAGLGAAQTVADAVTGITTQVDVGTVAQNLTTAIKTNGTADVVNYTFNKIGTADNLGTVTAAQAETVNITVADDTTVLGTGALTIASLATAAATTLNLSGNAATTVTVANVATPVLGTINAGSMTAAVTISGADLKSTGATVTLGSGNDVFTVDTANGADTFDLTKGGNDRIVYTAVAQSDSDMDTVLGFTSGSDDIDLRGLAGENVTTSSMFAGNFATFAQAQGALVTTAGAIKSVVYQQDEKILWVDVDNNGTLDNNDFRVKLDGVASIAATDLALNVGVTFTANAVGFNTATAANSSEANAVTNENDTINATVAQLVGATVDGLQGTDTINITATAAAGENANLSAIAFTNIETINVDSSVETVTINATDIAATQATTISGASTHPQTLAITHTGNAANLTAATIRNLETITFDGNGTLTIDNDNLTNVTTLTLSTANADLTFNDGGTYDFSSKTLTFTNGAGEVLTFADATTTMIVDAADIANVDTITGGGTDGVNTTMSFNDTTSLAGRAVTEVDTFTITTAAAANQTLTVDHDDYTTMAGADTLNVTFTGSGDDNLTFAVGGGAAAMDLSDARISGIDTIDVSAQQGGNVNTTIAAASITGNVTLVGDAAGNLLLADSGNYSNITLTAGDFDTLSIASATTVTVGAGMFSGAVVLVDSTAAGTDPNLTIAMGSATTLNLGTVAFGTTNGMATTITGSTGNDTITFADSKAAGSTMTASGNGGNDLFRLESNSGNGITLGGAGAQALVIADAVRVSDFASANDQVSVLATGIATGVATVQTKASGAATVDTAAFTLITGATMSDFSSLAQLTAAVGTVADATAADVGYFAVSNVTGSQVAIYAVQFKAAAAGALTTVDADDDVALVGVIDVTGTFAIGNMQVF